MKKNKTIPEQIWQFFCSVQLAVYTLVLLAATSVIGTIILQDGSPQQYIKLYGEPMYNLIRVFNINDMYHAWWFLFLILVLCINIVVCSIERLSITWKIIFPKKVTFSPQRFRRAKSLERFTRENETRDLSETYEQFLSKKVGPVIKETTETGTVLYAEKGRWTRFGVYVIHFSILLLLVGAMIGSLFGFKANLQLDEGKTSATAFDTKTRQPINIGFSIRCNDFNVKFYDTGAPEEFKSNLTILENNVESLTQDIRVNHPLRYKGINIFQASYGTARGADNIVLEVIRQSDQKTVARAVRVGETLELFDGTVSFKLDGFMPHFEFKGNDLGETFVGTIIKKDGNKLQTGLPIKFPTFDKMRKGEFSFVVKEFEQKYYTGLQITKDPGVWYVYAGFILLIVGCWVTFLMSHKSYFIEIEKGKENAFNISISGISNRNSQGMKLHIKKFVTDIKDR